MYCQLTEEKSVYFISVFLCIFYPVYRLRKDIFNKHYNTAQRLLYLLTTISTILIIIYNDRPQFTDPLYKRASHSQSAYYHVMCLIPIIAKLTCPNVWSPNIGRKIQNTTPTVRKVCIDEMLNPLNKTVKQINETLGHNLI